ncbi:MAG: glutamate--tRNA ligase [Promethearchaeota archaeon]
MEDEEIKKILWIAGLKNAVEFGGKPNKKAVMGKLMAQRADLRPKAKIIIPILDQIIEEIQNLSLDEQKARLLELEPSALEKKEKIKESKELPELPNLDKFDKVIMRLAPYPSGALHIGNARMIILNHEYVKRHKGELYLFYDDTIGSPKALRDSPNAKYVIPEAYDLIKEGLDWLGIKVDKIFYKSDRLEIYYEYCEKLIKDNLAYVCLCSADEFKKFKSSKKVCPHREQSIEKNLEEWKKMLDREYHEMEAVVRLKTGMDQKDPAYRDIIIMRISEAEHPRVGTKYTVWPMLEFSWAIDDHLVGITHILRGVDLIKEDFVENFIWDHFGWKKAEFLHYGRIKFPDMKLSKTYARNMIQKGIFRGWDDPRTWSLQSLKKRGIRPEALREALLDLGMSLTGITFSVNWLYAKNKAIIDDLSDRYFFVEDPYELIINNVPFSEYISEPLLNPNHPNKGTRKIHLESDGDLYKLFIAKKDAETLQKDSIFRLKDFINVSVVDKGVEGKIVANFHSKELNREFPIIHWVPQDSNISIKILKPDGTISRGKGEINLLKIPMEKPIQFERYGFVNPIELNDKELFCYFTH